MFWGRIRPQVAQAFETNGQALTEILIYVRKK
jgi:hypothetical protein